MKFTTPSITPLRTFSAILAALFSTMPLMACSDGPQAALPLAPSAVPSPLAPSAAPSPMIRLEAAGGIETWGTLGKGKDNDGQKGRRQGGRTNDGQGNPHHGAGPLDGTVSRFRGVCPVVTFNLKGTTIVTDAATTYVGGTCATLRPNVKVVVTGTPQAGRAGRRRFTAATITITRTHAPKVDICHREGNGSFHLINVSTNAQPAHIAHGDGLVGDPVPGMDGFEFDAMCMPVPVGPTAPSQLALTGPSSLDAGACSAVYQVESQDGSGNPSNVGSNTTVTLGGGGSGTFYTDSNCSTSTTTVTINSGTSTATFHFRDNTAEGLTLTADATGLTQGTLSVTVDAG